MFQVKTILNPRDFSEPSAETHETACDIARHYEAKLIFLHVTDKPVFSYFEQASELCWRNCSGSSSRPYGCRGTAKQG